MRRIRLLSLAAAAVTIAAAAAAPLAALAGPGTIQVKGSDTMVNLGQAWAEEYMKRRPDVAIAVTGGGSGTGIAALVNGTCDIAECSRAMKPKELKQVEAKGAPAKEFTVAIDALAVTVHPSNKIEKLTIAELSDIFTGKKTSWKDFGGEDREIVVLSRERNSGTHVYFLEHVVRRGNEKGPEEFAKTVLMMPSSQAIADEVAGNKDAIGFYGLGYVRPNVKPLAVAAKEGGEYVKPSAPDATAGRYPISRPLFMYTRGEPQGDAREFIDFCLSADGQKVVQKLDFVPLPEKK